MSKEQLKTKVRENLVSYLVILLVGSGGGSVTTALRGPDADDIAGIHADIQEIKIQFARMNQRLEDYIEHQRDFRKTASVK